MHRSITATYRKLYASTHDGTEQLMPLTGAQRRFHHTRSADPHGRIRILPVVIEFPPGLLSPDRLERAARVVLAGQPALRGTAHSVNGVPMLRIGSVPTNPIVEQIATSEADLERAVWAALEDWAAEHGSFRVLLARDEQRDLLVIAFDHLVCDGESTGLVLAELEASYQSGQQGPNSAADVDAGLPRYRDAVERQLAKEHAASDPEALAHWTSRVQDAQPGRWGRDRPAGDPTGQATAWRQLDLPTSTTERPFPLLLAGCHAALTQLPEAAPVAYTWGGQDDAGLVGCFINTVLANPQGDDVRESWWEDLEFADTPFDEVVRAARSCASAWTGHLDLVLTVIDRTRRTAPVLDGVPGQFRYPAGNSLADPVIVTAIQDQQKLSLRLDYDPTLVSADTSAAILDALDASFDQHLRG